MPVLAKVSWQIGQLAFKITLQLMKQISFRQIISPALLLLALSPLAERILHNQDCAFRAQTSNSSCLLTTRLSITSYSHSCPRQGILKAQIQDSLQWPMTKKKKKSYKDQHGPNIFLNVDGTQIQIKSLTSPQQRISIKKYWCFQTQKEVTQNSMQPPLFIVLFSTAPSLSITCIINL